MDLSDYMRRRGIKRESPLASRLCPKTLDEVVGQQHVVRKDKLLYRTVQADKLGSIIFYGSPGTGRTILAKVIANTTSADFRQINTTIAGKKDMEEVVERAKDNIGMHRRKTILFVDEIHRFNKGQQDYFLSFVEDGTLILIRATTEDPYFGVNEALLPRSRIFEPKPLEEDDVKESIRRVVYDKERGIGICDAETDEDAANLLADTANGNTRAALSAMEPGVLITARRPDGQVHINMAVAQECIQKRTIRYDENGDNHYDTISTFIRGIRGSGPGAAVHYLTRMLYAGEDIKPATRRIMMCITEDVENTDPQAFVVVVSAAQATGRIGPSGANIILPRVVTYVVTAPRSNAAYMAVQRAMGAVRNERTMPVLIHLQDKYYKGAEKPGHGTDYRYARDYPRHCMQQQYLLDGMEGTVFYEPSDNGYEKQIDAHVKWLKS